MTTIIIMEFIFGSIIGYVIGYHNAKKIYKKLYWKMTDEEVDKCKKWIKNG